ncbi:MAG: alpha/beta fold hydrolase [Flavobacteriales bacterium]
MEEKFNIKIKCEDNFELSGTLYKTKEIKAAIMITAAMGTKKQFYDSFAQFLSKKGYGVLTFDYRGIGESTRNSINGVNASLINWGKLDMTAVLEELKLNFPNTSYHLIGHSAGGQLVGLMKNANELKSMFTFGCSSGSIKHSQFPFKLKSFFWFNFYIPVSNLLFGHTKSQWVGMGEPLPKLVAEEWGRWCKGENSVKVDLDQYVTEHLYNELTLKSLWVYAVDDEIVNDKTMKDMIEVYTKIKSELTPLNPADYGFSEIGHMKFFSSKKEKLWNIVLHWLDKNKTLKPNKHQANSH